MTTHDKLAAAREEGRNQGLREAAEVASEHADLLRTKSADRAYNDACFNIEDAILALIAASAPIQAEKIMCSRCDGSGYVWAVGNCPDCTGDGWVNAPQPDAEGEICPDCMGSGYIGHPDGTVGCYRCRGQGRIAPQPDEDEREAMVTVIGNGIFATPADHEAIDLASNIADALLADGWTRKRDLLK